MSIMPTISPRIIVSLYGEALVLAEDVREQFDAFRSEASRTLPEHDCIALSCEALRTTNRMMHCMAWLLNHRAHLRGEISALQLRRVGRLMDSFPPADAPTLALMPDELRHTIAATQRLYERVAWLDRAWRNNSPVSAPNAIERLRQRVSTRMRSVAG